MAEDTSAIPLRYYSYTSTFESIFVNLKFKAECVSGFDDDDELHTFLPARLTPECDLEMSIRREKNFLKFYVEKKKEKSIKLNTTITARAKDGEELYHGILKNLTLPKKLKLYFIDQINMEDLHEYFLIEIKLEVNLGKLERTQPIESDGKCLEDMKNLILAEHPEEICLKTKDGQISVNKAILCARSPVFGKMFDHPMTEKEENIVKIDDVNITTLKTLVDFLYSGKLKLPPETEFQSLKELYYAADKYDVQDLRKNCIEIMVSTLSERSVIGVLLLARQHSNQHLKEKCLRFIHHSSSCIEAVMETEDWICLKDSDPKLTIEILSTFVK